MTKIKKIETERLYIRPVEIEDAAFFFELFNTKNWIKYIGDRNVKNVNEATEYIQKVMQPQVTLFGPSNYTIIRKEDNKKIGCCGLYNRNGVKGLDIGYALLPKYEGNGYAYEASSKILQIAFEDYPIHQISAIITKDNASSYRLLAKMRFDLTGTITLPNEKEELLLFKIENKN